MSFSLRKAVAIAAILIGAVWSLALLGLPLFQLATDRGSRGVLVFVMMILMSFPGWVCLSYGVKLFRAPNDTFIIRSVGWAIGILVFLAYVVIGTYVLPYLFPLATASELRHAFPTLMLLTLFAIPVYVSTVNVVRRSEGIPTNKYVGLLSNGFIILVGLQVWFGVLRLFMHFAPIEEYRDPVQSFLYPFAAFVVPFLVALFIDNTLARKAGISRKRSKPIGPYRT